MTGSRMGFRTGSRARTKLEASRSLALLTNTGALVTARYVVAALGWVGTLVIVRHLSVDEFGRFSFVFSLFGLLAVFTELGLGRVAIKGLLDDAHDPARFAGTLVVLRAVLAVVMYGAALTFVVVADYPGEVVRATAVAGAVVLLATPSHAIEAVFQVHLRMGTVAVSNVAGQLTQLALVAAIATAGGSVVLFALPAVACEVVIFVWRVVTVRSLQPVRLTVDWQAWRKLLREAAPLTAGVVLIAFASRVDSILLSRMDTFSAVGVYGVANKFVDIAHYLPSALMVPVLALLVPAWPDDAATFARTVRRAFTILVVVGTITAVEFVLFARPVVGLLYGDEYTVGANATRLLVVAECVNAFGGLAFTCLVAMGRYVLYPVAALAGLVANVALNLWLIPSASYGGAAVARLVTQLLVTSVLWIVLARLPTLRPLPLEWVGKAALAGVSAIVVGAVGRVVLPWPAAAALAAAVYAGLLRATGVHRAIAE